MLGRILSERQEEILARERRALGELRAELARADADAESQRALAESIGQLEELFLLVVVGEFNAGKSAFINALLGEEVVLEGVTPTTSEIQWIRYGPERRSEIGEGGVTEIEAPIEILRQVNLVDTPGTNAITREHEVLTRRFVPRSDLVLFVTSADRPFTESERAFLESLRDWGKKILVAINKTDILEEEQVSEVVDFVSESCHRLLGFVPEIFPLSAKRALAERGGGEQQSSGLDAVESYIDSTLEDVEVVRLKLLNPLRVGERVLSEELVRSDDCLELLSDDFQTLSDLELQLEQYREDMSREFEFRLGDVDGHLHKLEVRGERFFDETLRLGRLPDLINRSRVETLFEREVIADMPREIDRQVQDLIDWMVAGELRQWQAVRAHVARREHQHAERIVGDASALEASRSSLLATLGSAAQGAVEGYDRQREAQRLADSVRTALAGAALLEVGAVGLGSVVAAAATSTAVDITGMLAAGLLAALGLFVIPARRRRAKVALRDRLAELRETLMSSMRREFDREIERSLARLEEATAPYTRFVRAERGRLEGVRERLTAVADELRRLNAEIEGLGPAAG